MPSYKNPILIEVYAELSLEHGQLNPQHFFSIGPRLASLGLTQVDFQTVTQSVSVRAPASGPPEMKLDEVPRVRCWHPDRTKLVQFSPDLIVVNLLRPYTGWQTFEGLFRATMLQFEQVLGGALRGQTLSFLTTDQMRVAREGFSIGRYLNTGGLIVPAWYRDVAVAADLSLGYGQVEVDGHNRSLSIHVRPSPADVAIEIKAAFRQHLRGRSGIANELNELHEQSNETFEALVTDTTRNVVMGGQQ
jgi:hypothetical protein